MRGKIFDADLFPQRTHALIDRGLTHGACQPTALATAQQQRAMLQEARLPLFGVIMLEIGRERQVGFQMQFMAQPSQDSRLSRMSVRNGLALDKGVCQFELPIYVYHDMRQSLTNYHFVEKEAR
jgi:hypothetical protein